MGRAFENVLNQDTVAGKILKKTKSLLYLGCEGRFVL